ncbi:MAG: hypothetical protein U0270_16685 [Labilithrix sp.]
MDPAHSFAHLSRAQAASDSRFSFVLQLENESSRFKQRWQRPSAVQSRCS